MVTLLWSFRNAELARVAELLGRVGGAALLIPLPQFLALLVESIGWRGAFDAMGQRLPLSGLFRARLATEALAQTLPAGVVFCESMKPLLLARNCNADLPTSLSGMAARKWLLVLSQSLYLGGFALLTVRTPPAIPHINSALRTLPSLLGLGAGFLLLLAVGGYFALARGRVASRIHRALCSVRWPWLARRVAPLASRFEHADGRLAVFFANAFRSPLPLLSFLGGWALEAVETVLILRLLGVRLPWPALGAVEVSASFLRNVAFVVPAGLGVQDLGYLSLLKAFDLADVVNVTAAFLLLKRGKECFWAVVGYVILALDLRPQEARKALETC